MEWDRAQLAALAAVVEEGSFEGAARRLHLTPSAVSQRIRALEARAGQVLVRRARPGGATRAGTVLVRLAGQIALLEHEVATLLGTEDDRGRTGPFTVTLAVNADSLDSWFAPVLLDLPDGIVLDVRTADQDRSADLLRDGTAMAAVTADPSPVQGCRSVPLGAMPYLAVAAPDFRSRWFPRGVDASSLAQAPQVAYDPHDALQRRFAEQHGAQDAAPVHHVPAQRAFTAAIGAGLGWGMVPSAAAAPLVARGDLVELSPGSTVDVPLVWQHWRLDSPVLNHLTDAVRRAAARALRSSF
ncbi:LysR family transcriptional regulator ArgP [Actinotalea sp.]|uniref:LysR family transcriptional regulator ArgP n=1 Tax=Actinotalea sp. TaxID=1872145 RepID=UPI0035647995